MTDGAFHEFSKTFRAQHAFRPDPDRFVAELNHWLWDQPGVVGVSPRLHFGLESRIRGATVTCYAGLVPSPVVFQFHRLPLSFTGPYRLPRGDLGSALNEWIDAHPEHERVWDLVVDPAGIPVECWLLTAAPRSIAHRPPAMAEPTGFMGVHRLPAAIVFTIASFFLLAGVAARESLGFIAGSLAVTALCGWLTRRFPPWRRKSAVEPALRRVTLSD